MGQRDQYLVLAFALGPFPVVVIPARRIETDGRERGEKLHPFHELVAFKC